MNPEQSLAVRDVDEARACREAALRPRRLPAKSGALGRVPGASARLRAGAVTGLGDPPGGLGSAPEDRASRRAPLVAQGRSP